MYTNFIRATNFIKTNFMMLKKTGETNFGCYEVWDFGFDRCGLGLVWCSLGLVWCGLGLVWCGVGLVQCGVSSLSVVKRSFGVVWVVWCGLGFIMVLALFWLGIHSDLGFVIVEASL